MLLLLVKKLSTKNIFFIYWKRLYFVSYLLILTSNVSAYEINKIDSFERPFLKYILECQDGNGFFDLIEGKKEKLNKFRFTWGNSALGEAIYSGCLFAVKELINSGVEISSPEHRTLLDQALFPRILNSGSELEIAKILLQNGVKPDDFGKWNAVDQVFEFPRELHRKLFRERKDDEKRLQFELLKLLHSFGLQLNILDRQGKNLLFNAVYQNNYYVYCYLKFNEPNLPFSEKDDLKGNYDRIIKREISKGCESYK